jgi:hypothetical protein
MSLLFKSFLFSSSLNKKQQEMRIFVRVSFIFGHTSKVGTMETPMRTAVLASVTDEYNNF